MQILQVPIDKIDTSDRKRTDFGDLIGLAVSIQQLGLIHPILVEPLPSGVYKLLAGERRLRAYKSLGKTEIPATTRESLTELERRVYEAEENLRRLNMTWQEETLLKDELHRLKQQQFGAAGKGQNKGLTENKWGLNQTAALLQESRQTVGKDLMLAAAIKESPQLAAELAKFPKAVAIRKLEHIRRAEKAQQNVASMQTIDMDLRLGSCVDGVLSLADASIDLIVTDPPFGVAKIDTAKGTYSSVLAESDNSTAMEFVRTMSLLLPELFRVLKEGSHMYVFYGAEWQSKLIEMITAVGFEVDPVPLIWDKGRTTTPCRGYNYAQMYEPILFCRKPPREKRLLNKSAGNILRYAPIQQKEHPFHKAPELIQFLISQSSHPGETVLDPFAGSGETLKSAKLLSRKSIGFELDEANYYRAMAYISGQSERKENAVQSTE